MQAEIAVLRFGLGAKPGELNTAAADPRAWLMAQIKGPAPLAVAAPGAAAPGAAAPAHRTPAAAAPDDSFLEFLGSDDVGDAAWWEFLKKAPPSGSDASAKPPQDAKK